MPNRFSKPITQLINTWLSGWFERVFPFYTANYQLYPNQFKQSFARSQNLKLIPPNSLPSFAIALLALCLLKSHLSQSQVFYSVNPNFLLSKPNSQALTSKFRTSYPDTSVNDLHNYAGFNFMGNIGLPSPIYKLSFGSPDLGFQVFNPLTSSDNIAPHQIQYYQSMGPYVNLTGWRGNKNFQGFKMLYTQTFANQFNVAIKFNRYSSQGFYLNQQTVTQNFAASSHYTNKSNRIGFYFYFLTNENKNEENGGLKAVYLNPATVSEIKNFQAVHLSDASRLNKNASFSFNPWLRLNKQTDSISTYQHFIQLKSTYDSKLFWYNDKAINDDKFYSLFVYDSLRTNDSTRLKQFSNELQYALTNPSKQLSFSAGYKNELNYLWQKTDSFLVNHIAQTRIAYSSKNFRDSSDKKYFESTLNFQYVFDGPNKNNHKILCETNYWLDKKFNKKLFFLLVNEGRSADYFYQFWRSNNFTWSNQFKKQNQTQLNAGLNLNNYFVLSCLYQNIQNFLYLNTLAQPAQLNKSVHNAAFSISFTNVFFKHIGWSLNHTFQSTSHDSYLRIPHHISGTKLFYQHLSKTKLLQLQMGAQLQIFDTFNGYSYMPATQSFYLNQDYKTSASPFLDLYLNVRIRPVSIFLKAENILQGWVDTNYSFVRGYYQPERAFRFGINWVFFD